MQYTIRDERSRSRGAQISAIVEAPAETAGSSGYRIRFKRPTTPTFADEHLKLELDASNLFIAGWIKNHFLNQISLVVQAVTKPFLSRPGTRRLDPKNINSLEEKDMK